MFFGPHYQYHLGDASHVCDISALFNKLVSLIIGLIDQQFIWFLRAGQFGFAVKAHDRQYSHTDEISK